MITPGLCSVTFRHESPESLIRICQDAGLKAIEWGADVHVPPGDLENAARVGSMTQEAGLEVAAYGSYHLAFDTEDTPSAPFDPVLQTAIALKAPIIRIWAGSLEMEKSPAYFETVVRQCREAAVEADKKGIQIALEYHRNTYTETLGMTLELLEAVDHPNLKMYWQPRHGSSLDDRIRELNALKEHLLTVHVFHWGGPPPPFARHALNDGRDLWIDCLKPLAQSQKKHFALLEFVREDSREQFSQDADTLLKWLQ